MNFRTPPTENSNQAIMRHPVTQSIYSYWNELRRGRVAPQRLEIDPQRIGDALLDTFILELADDGQFHFRLAGSRIGSRLGFDLRGKLFEDCWAASASGMLKKHMADAVERGRVIVLTAEAVFLTDGVHADDRAPQTFEIILLPLIHAGRSVDRLLCVMAPLSDESHPEGNIGKIQCLRLDAGESVWPDKTSLRPIAVDERQVPFEAGIVTSRLVRNGRRQFRVYDGGRQTPRE